MQEDKPLLRSLEWLLHQKGDERISLAPASSRVASGEVRHCFTDGTTAAFRVAPPSTPSPATIGVYRNALLSDPHDAMSGGWAHPLGAAYDQRGDLIPESQFRGAQDLAKKAPDQTPDELEGDWVFGGYYNEIYGHFILESVARLWALGYPELADWNVVFFPIRSYRPTESSYTRWFFEAFGLKRRNSPEPRIKIANRPTLVQRLVVPSRTYDIQLGPQTNFAAQIRPITSTAQPADPQMVYLSRRKLHLGNHKFINEKSIERVFGEHGFRTVHPQELPPQEQIDLYFSATHIAGSAGSALHNSIFAPADAEILAINGRFDQSWRLKALADGTNFPHPVCPQDHLCIALGQRLTYMHAHRCFDIDGQLLGRMPYYIDPGIAQAGVERWLRGHPPIQVGEIQGVESEDVVVLLAELIQLLLSAQCFSQAAKLLQLFHDVSDNTGLSADFEGQLSRNSNRPGQTRAVRLFPDLDKDAVNGLFRRNSGDALVILEKISDLVDERST